MADSRTRLDAPAIYQAAKEGRVDELRRLIASGANPDERDSAGGTPLVYACQAACDLCVVELLRAGADPLIVTKTGVGPLHALAMRRGEPAPRRTAAIYRALVSRGVSIHRLDRFGRSALQYASDPRGPNLDFLAAQRQAN